MEIESIPGISYDGSTIHLDARYLIYILQNFDFKSLIGHRRICIIPATQHEMQSSELLVLMYEMSNLGIKNLYIRNISFNSLIRDRMQDIPILEYKCKQKLKSLTLEICPRTYWFILSIFPKIDGVYKCRFPLLKNITIVSNDAVGPIRILFACILEDNYVIRQLDISAYELKDEHHDSALFCKLHNYTKRNRDGYNKCISAVTILLGLRRFRYTLLFLLDKNIMKAVSDLILETNGTKIWCN